ncbi:MAG: apolipoprotein N-acyltransferase [Pseudomonadota bacterium]
MNRFLSYYKISFFFQGALLALAFAPVFFWPALLVLSVFAHYIRKAESIKLAAKYGLWFGFGFFTFSLYWIAIGVSVYIDDFWWALPFALFGLPFFLGFFIAITSAIAWRFRASPNYSLYFSLSWVLLEWIRSWIFTGFPWNLLGYSLCFSDELVQLGSVFGPYGMSFIVVYFMAGISCNANKNSYLIFALTSIISIISFGSWRLSHNPTSFTNTTIRIVQPSISQEGKWSLEIFWKNLSDHVELSRINTGFNPDIILWPEAAVTAPYHTPSIQVMLKDSIILPKTVLITGGITDNGKPGQDYELYSGLYALNYQGASLFEYHKSHLVPFGEYMPLKSFLPIKKLTHGLIDYVPGVGAQVFDLRGLRIRPLVCYEAIFPSEVRGVNYDVLFNITNDAWYGNSSGPYQHLQISRMRAVENGTPLVRAANNGISAIIDPMGRVLAETKLNHITALDGIIPSRMQGHTLYSMFGEWMFIIIVVGMSCLRKIIECIYSILYFLSLKR